MNNPPDNSVLVTSRSEPLFTKCCCCIPLRVGCFIFGYLDLLFNGYEILKLVTATCVLFTKGFDNSTSKLVTSHINDHENALAVVRVILVILTIASIIQIILTIACLVGLHKSCTRPMKVYIDITIVGVFLKMMFFIHDVPYKQVYGGLIFGYIIALAFEIYCLLVFYVYIKQLDRENLEVVQSYNAQVKNTAVSYPTNGQINNSSVSYPTNGQINNSAVSYPTNAQIYNTVVSYPTNGSINQKF